MIQATMMRLFRTPGQQPAPVVTASVDPMAAYTQANRYLDTWTPSYDPRLAPPVAAMPAAPVAPPPPPMPVGYTVPEMPAPPAAAPMPMPSPPVAAPLPVAALPAPAPMPAPPAPAPLPAPKPAPKAEEAPKHDDHGHDHGHDVEGKGPLLMKGHGGEVVKKLQARLKELGFDPGGVDGIFGPKTDAAVREFQKAKGLEVDGKVGPQTWKALGIVVEGTPERAPGVARATPSGANDGKTVNTPKGPMVGRQGKLISARIADNFDRMVEAAKKDGVSLIINSGFRSYEEQVHLYNLYKSGKGNIAAKPGTSNHESGDAIDFANVGRAWSWLKANSQKFGFKNFDPEPWHYSPTGT